MALLPKEADWVFANEDQDVKELAYLAANLPDSEETYDADQDTVAKFASALLRFPTEQQEAAMKFCSCKQSCGQVKAEGESLQRLGDKRKIPFPAVLSGHRFACGACPPQCGG